MKYSISILLVFVVTLCVAQETDLSLFKYREVGPFRGGRSTAVAGVEGMDNVFYFGATGGGVWKTEDYGLSWKNVSDGYFESPSIGALRVAANDPNIVYVGTGSDGLRSNVISGKGVYKSIDAGNTWTHVGLKKTGHIGAVEINPNDHNNVYVAAIGQAFNPNPERGIFRTKDGGKSWEKVLFISEKTGFVDLEFMPSNPNIIYAAAWMAERKPWTIKSGGDENGIYKSIDGGDTWEKLTNGLPSGIVGKIDLAVSRADSKVLYALIEAANDQGGLYRSNNQGESFTRVSDNRSLLVRPFYFLNIDADPSDAETVYVNSLRFHKSTDGGKNWERIRTPHGDDHDVWINPSDPDLMVQANDGGANVSTNGGKTWTHQFNQPTAELYQVEVDDQYPYWLYAGQQDNGSTISVPSLPPHGHQAGATGLIMETGGCETGPAVPKPGNSDIVYSNCKGRFSVFNKSTGIEQSYDVGARYMYGHNPKDLKFRFQRVSPIHVSPHNPDKIYHTSQYVHVSTDDGKTWDIISPDLTAFEKDKQVISGSPITRDITGEEFYSTIYAIRESSLEEGVIWVGANDGPVHVTQDGGKNWKKVTPKKLEPGGRVDAVEPSPHQAGKAYISVLRYQLGDWSPYIYKTTDYGKSWTKITNGIPGDHPVRVVREDPDREGLLYAGTEYGIFVSFDDGANWQSFRQNFPVVPVTDLKVFRQDLVISTMGRGFWILDDLSPLHQMLEQTDKQAIKLFAPRDTYSMRLRGGTMSATGLPGPTYPSPGVRIHYYLPIESKMPIKLEIMNEQGEVLRTIISKTDSVQKETGVYRDMATNQVFFSESSALANKKGFHSYRWDMRHTGPWSSSESSRYNRGPLVAPGTYGLRLTVEGKVHETEFQLLQDPRTVEMGVTRENLLDQETLNLQIVSLLSEMRKEADRINKEIAQLEEQSIRSVNEESNLEGLRELKSKLETAEGTYMQPMLISQLEYLRGITGRTDQVVGNDAKERFAELKQEWEDFKKQL